MISRINRLHVKYNEFPEVLQRALDFHLEDTGDVLNSGFSYEWIVYDNPDYDTDCPYQTQEYVVNVFLLSQGIPADTAIYIDL